MKIVVPLNERRNAAVEVAWKRLTETGTVSVSDLKCTDIMKTQNIERYDASRSWDVMNARKSAADAAADFAAQWTSDVVTWE